MTDNEMLLAMSDMMDKKLKPINEKLKELEPMNEKLKKLDQLENNLLKLSLCIENEIRPNIQLLAENYVPAAKRYELAVPEIEALKRDVDILKKVVTEHSKKLEKIAGN